jgi:LCP family protein required for cell wall assembly
LDITASRDRRAPATRGRPSLWLRFFIGFFLLVFVAGGLYSGYLFYATIREIVASAELPAMPVIQLPSIHLPEAVADEKTSDPLPTPQLPETTPLAGSADLSYQPPAAPQVETVDRINILLLGVDRRGGKSWEYRTDTIIIITVDPVNKTVGMLSIPRDLQIPIPGYGEERINVANRYGELNDYPGGGPALLERTIEVNFGVSIDYYVMIDFKGFEKIVDTLGGIDVNVPRALRDTMYPDPQPGDPNGYKTVKFEAGWQHMNGQRALEYARSRMSTSDFDRADRQQRILLAIREKALSLNIIPKIPALFATAGNMVRTDIPPGDMLDLGLMASQIDVSTLKRVVLKKPLVYGFRTEAGAAVQLPKWDLINPVIADLFTTPVIVLPTSTPEPPTPTPTLAPVQIEELQELADEGARIAVQNGTSEPNFAARVAAMLMEQGYQVVEFGDADRLDYPNTVIVDYTGKSYTLERLVEKFQVAPENVRHSPNLRSQIDVRVIVGQDSLFLVP